MTTWVGTDLALTWRAVARPRTKGQTSTRRPPPQSRRYTPPLPKSAHRSPIWVPVAMTALLAVGALAILLDYLGVLPAAPNGWYLLGGLVLVVLGFLVATRWR